MPVQTVWHDTKIITIENMNHFKETDPRLTLDRTIKCLGISAVLMFLFASHTLCAADADHTLAVPDQGWHLWPDTNAAWKNDPIFLPGDFDLVKLPVNAPTGGWELLDDKNGKMVSLPGTVEEHFWGKFGLRHYTDDEYFYAKKGDQQVMNGNYLGVSWWWREIVVPASFTNKIIQLHIRGARQRAEVFVNRQLVGYNIIAETSFSCDISKSIRPGETNQIAIRITNPGGRLDWLDTRTLKWGTERFQTGHGFGGLDRGITITAQDSVYLDDTWVLNTPQARTVTAHATVQNSTSHEQSGDLIFTVTDHETHTMLTSSKVSVQIPANGAADFQMPLTCEKAELWNLEHPRLYEMETKLDFKGTVAMRDAATKEFGFRWFEPRGIGQQAGLYLNDRRIRLYTAISWGFWGFNGVWPTPELADKEVRAAKELGLNMLNFHREIGKEEVLARQDQLGLLRYMEAGGGFYALGKMTCKSTPSPSGALDTSGTGGDAISFAQKYEETKILRMIRQFRSHPSLVIYMIQNECEPDLSDPRVFNLLQKMHALDPSRVIATKSGVSPLHQAWFAPYDSTPRHDDGSGFSGWRDEHTVGGSGVWQDEMYQSPTNFTHRIMDHGEIVDWGEMLGAAVADNHPLMVQQILAHGGTSYDLADHQHFASVYDRFLDRWNFRSAFPTNQQFYGSLGNKCYEFWGKVIEAARLAEDNDILTISGWESTAIEDHSGLVDNLRNFKGDPALLAPKLAPLLPVVKPRQLTCRLGASPVLDLYLLNETGLAAGGKLHLKIIDPSGNTNDLWNGEAPVYRQNHFVYPVKIGFVSPPLSKEGRFTFQLSLEGKSVAQNSETVLVVNPVAGKLPASHVGIVGNIVPFQKQWAKSSPVKVERYREDGKYDMVIAASEPTGNTIHATNEIKILNTDDEALYQSYMRGNSASTLCFHFESLPVGKVKVSLYFSETSGLAKGERVFDVVVNDHTVLTNFDIAAEVGTNSALVKTFTVEAPQGIVDIAPVNAPNNPAMFNAIKLEVVGKTVAVVCGGKTYRDKTGLVWQPYTPATVLSSNLLQRVRAGMPLLVMPGDIGAADKAARQLADAGAFSYAGKIPSARAAWMGNWIFVRQHPLFAGLPVNEVLHGDYQIPVWDSYGLLVDGTGVEVIAGYGRDHDTDLGAATFTAKLNRGTVVFQTLTGMSPVIRERLLNNALVYLDDLKFSQK